MSPKLCILAVMFLYEHIKVHTSASALKYSQTYLWRTNFHGK